MSSRSERRGSEFRDRAVGLGAALLIGLNLRPAITSVAALLEPTRAAFDLAPVQLNLLATLPVIAFGISAPVGPLLARRLGVTRALIWTMVALAGSLALRVVVPGGMLPGTFLAGVSIMAAGTLLPQYLKSLRAGGLWIGLSSMSFSAGAALGAGLAVPLSTAVGGPAVALGLWAVPALIAAGAMVGVALRSEAPPPPSSRMALPRSARPTVALITAMFGLQAMLFFAVASWLPRILGDRGVDAQTAGWLLALTSVAGLVPTLVAPILARRRRVLRLFGPGLGIVMLAAFVWLASGDESYIAITVVLGAVQSATFGLSLALIVMLAADEASAGLLSAIAQGVGYAFAGAGSLLVGVLHDLTGGWTASLVFMIVCAAALALVVGFVIRCRPVDLQAPSEVPALPRA
ncbi:MULTISPECIES: MFS transporter [unclassified Microbacterium]|uniref:MFS transporter n=1 Tax=unclassified Microbacterium TaxID=2609290 RepID=UPI000D008CC0|nr:MULTISPECIES: MFS transporter [unclassified Microbacterium]PRB64954.1 MFS transporter [Microbacterium sp. MYb45]